jgi:hypothetical protein
MKLFNLIFLKEDWVEWVASYNTLERAQEALVKELLSWRQWGQLYGPIYDAIIEKKAIDKAWEIARTGSVEWGGQSFQIKESEL